MDRTGTYDKMSDSESESLEKDTSIVYKPKKILALKDIDPEERMNMVKAIVTEISNLCKLGVFSLEVMEDSSNPISTKFVLKVKRKADGSYDKHKARLVVRGFLAKMGVDFYATFSMYTSCSTCHWHGSVTSYAHDSDLPMPVAAASHAFKLELLRNTSKHKTTAIVLCIAQSLPVY